ncbi:peptidase M50 [Nostoc cycadae WK-1]|uniref:Peptidase M50 n=2 Tax=Nostoc cycadae TaxID=246795 RepID=A0A2H6LPX7_9NOSO|nr:peptidase M50 [Nostoc cycadae WK-1]
MPNQLLTKTKNTMLNQCVYANTPQVDHYTKIELEVLNEHLRQARQTFNLCLIASCTFLCISTVGTLLILYGKTSEGTVITATGVFSTTFMIYMNRLSSYKMKEIIRTLEKLNRTRK